MRNKNIKLIITLAIILTLSFSSLPFSAKAAQGNLKSKLQARATVAETASSTKSIKTAKTVTDAIAKADTDIAKRIDSLNKTLEKVQAMKNVSTTEKNSSATDVQSEITKLQALKSKVDADTDLATIKTDLASIVSGSRIYVLVIPKINILASVDKVNTVATMLGTISVKLQARIDEVKASSTSSSTIDTAALQTALDNIIKKTADAKNEALTAQTTISGLVPDNGDKAKLDSNNADIKSAKANIKTANQDLADARKYASVITKGLKSPSDTKAVKATSTKAVKAKKTK